MDVAPPTYALLYRSRAVGPLTMGELRRIIEGSLGPNRRLGVTGLLLFDGEPRPDEAAAGSFVQWLEGPEETVRALYERIVADPRHTDVQIEAAGPIRTLAGIEGRLFPRWAMALALWGGPLPTTLRAFLAYYDERVGRRGSGSVPW